MLTVTYDTTLVTWQLTPPIEPDAGFTVRVFGAYTSGKSVLLHAVLGAPRDTDLTFGQTGSGKRCRSATEFLVPSSERGSFVVIDAKGEAIEESDNED